MFTSLEQFPSKTSSIASIPWEETSCESISGESVRMKSWVRAIVSGNRSGEGNLDGHQLVTGFLQLKVGRSRRELVDKLVNQVAEAGMLVPLQVGFQVIFGESFVNLKEFSAIGRQRGVNSPHLRKWILLIGVFIPKLNRSLQPHKIFDIRVYTNP